jgi:molecular chaperone GrpE
MNAKAHSDQSPEADPETEEILRALDFEPAVEERLDDEIVKQAETIVDLREQLARAQAEFINFRNRSHKERENLATLITASVIEKLLPVLDEIDRIEQAGEVPAPTLMKLRTILQSIGLVSFGEIGDSFDNQIHQAIMSNPVSGIERDTVAEIVAKGYQLHDHLLRPAQVVVNSVGSDEPEAKSERKPEQEH